MMAISKSPLAIAFGLLCALFATAAANANCSHASLQALIPKFATARDEMVSNASKSYADLTALDQQVSTCLRAETDSLVRFKLTLVETGLRAYIGAADASRGNVARGDATAQAAMQDAQRLVRDNRANPTNLQLAQQLVTQVQRPLAIISKLEPHGH